MKSGEKSLIEHELLQQLVALPHKIIQLHGVPSLPELVLHELCHDHCFNIDRAAYLLDNPDFDWLQGIAGYTRDECGHHKKDLWLDPHAFEIDMQHAPYRQEIKRFVDHSLSHTNRKQYTDEELLQLGKRLGIDNPLCFTWGTKHDNQGILIVQDPAQGEDERKRLLYNVMSLLSIC